MFEAKSRFLRVGGSSWRSNIDPKRFQKRIKTTSRNIEQEEARRRTTRTTKRDNMSSQNVLTPFDGQQGFCNKKVRRAVWSAEAPREPPRIKEYR